MTLNFTKWNSANLTTNYFGRPAAFGFTDDDDCFYCEDLGKFYKFNTTGTIVGTSLQSYPSSCVVDGTDLYVVCRNANVVKKFDLQLNSVNETYITVTDPIGMCIDGSFVYLTHFTANKVSKYNKNDGSLVSSSFITGLNRPNSIRIVDSVIYISNGSGGGFIGKYNLNGTVINTSLITGLTSLCNMLVYKNSIYTVSSNSNILKRYNTSGNLISTQTLGFTTANYALGLNLSGFVFVSTKDGIYKSNSMLDPTITSFSNITMNVSDPVFTLSPTSNSTGAFTFTSSNTAVASISENSVTINGEGVSIITVNQAAADNYESGSMTLTLTIILQIAPTISSPANIAKNVGEAAFTLSPPTSNSTGAFTYTSSNTAVATFSDSTVSVIGVGTTTITATQAATTNYLSGSKTFTITVSPIAPTISPPANIPKTVGDPNFTLTPPTSNSTGAFTYASSNTAVATISGSTVSVMGAGFTTITATQAATTNYLSGSATIGLTVSPAAPTISSLIFANRSLTINLNNTNQSVSGYTYSLDNGVNWITINTVSLTQLVISNLSSRTFNVIVKAVLNDLTSASSNMVQCVPKTVQQLQQENYTIKQILDYGYLITDVSVDETVLKTLISSEPSLSKLIQYAISPAIIRRYGNFVLQDFKNLSISPSVLSPGKPSISRIEFPTSTTRKITCSLEDLETPGPTSFQIFENNVLIKTILSTDVNVISNEDGTISLVF